MVVAIGDCVDSAFGNNIDVDTIVVMESFLTLSWFLACIAKIGSYVYRFWQRNVWTCMIVSVAASIVSSIIILMFKEPIIHFYTLTDVQYDLLRSVVTVYGCCLPMYGVGHILDMYCLMKGRMKCLVVADIVYYIFLIGLDVLVVFLKLNCVWLIAGTMFSYLLYTLILLFTTGILLERETVTINNCLECFKHGCNFMMSKLAIRVAIIFMRTTVSKMGTELYALYTVANAVEEFNENYVAAWENYLTVNVKRYEKERRFIVLKEKVRKYSKVMLLLICCSIPVTSFVLKGELSYANVLCSACLVALGNVFSLFERAFYAYLSACEKSNILRWDGIVGASVRIALCWTIYLFGGNLVAYLLCYPVDTLCRAAFMILESRKTNAAILRIQQNE